MPSDNPDLYGARFTPLLPIIPDSSLNSAKWTYERLARSIITFENNLDEDMEIGARLVSFTADEIIHIDDIGYWGPDIVTFYGVNANGHAVELLQNISQVNVLLVAVPKEKDVARRIGFELAKKLESD